VLLSASDMSSKPRGVPGKEEEKCKENGPAKEQPAMRGTNDKMEDAKNQSKKKMISTMSKSTIMQAHHGTKNESGNKEAILA